MTSRKVGLAALCQILIVFFVRQSGKRGSLNGATIDDIDDIDAFFNFSFFIKTKQNFQNKTGLSIPVNLNASKRKEGKSHCLLV